MQIQHLADIVDHELDDTNDNYEASLGLLMKGQCGEATRNAYKTKCAAKTGINDQFDALMKQIEAQTSTGN